MADPTFTETMDKGKNPTTGAGLGQRKKIGLAELLAEAVPRMQAVKQRPCMCMCFLCDPQPTTHWE